MTTGRINQVAILLRNAGRSRVSLHNMARPSRGTAPRASAPPPATIAAGTPAAAVKHRREESPTARKRPPPRAQRPPKARAAPRPRRTGKAPSARAPKNPPTRPPRAPESAFTPSNPTHPRTSPDESTARPRNKARATGLARRGRSWATTTIAATAHPHNAPGGTGGGTRRATAASPAAPSTDQCSITFRIHTSHTVNVRKPKGSLFLDARRPGAHTTTHAPGPPQTVPHRILGTRSTPAPAPAGTKRKQGDPTPFNGCAARAKPNTHRAHARPHAAEPTAARRPAHAQCSCRAHPMPHSRFRQDGGAHTPGRH